MCNKKDQIRVLGPPDDDGLVPVVRNKDGELRPALLEQHEEGKPIHTEIVHLEETDCPITYDVKTLFDPADYQESDSGPAMVNSPAFKAGWDRVFGGKEDDLAN